MINAFLDLETLGTGPAPAIVQIGLVIFDTENAPHRSSFLVDWAADLEVGGELDPDCLRWWVQGTVEQRTMLALGKGVSFAEAFAEVRSICSAWEVQSYWANGHDWAWLEAAGRRHKLKPFWPYSAVRDLRTLRKTVCAGIEIERDDAGKHDALADALWGARLVQEMHRQKGGIL